MEIEYEPRFLEEAVLRAAALRPEGRLFRRERERVYRVGDPEARGRAFDELNLAWCERLGLSRPLVHALAEQPLVTAGVARCAVGRPPHPRDAGAELLVRATEPGAAAASGRLLRLLVAPELLLSPEALVPWLRRELLHAADMLEPRFGYVPHLSVTAGGPGHDHLARERYRVVWDATVDGRLLRAGRLPRETRAARRAEFLRAFALLGAVAEDAFLRFFLDPEPTHAAIAAFVAAAGRASDACALCGFTSADLETAPAELPAAVLSEIARDAPGWRPADGLCRQCADLYRARPLSRAGEAALPGLR